MYSRKRGNARHPSLRRTHARKRSLVALCAALAACAQTPTGTVKETVAPERELSEWEASVPMKQAIAAAHRFWSKESSYYDEDIRVLSATSGAFTQPDVAEMAILYRMTLYPRGFPSKGLAIVEGDRLVRNFAFVMLSEDVSTLADFDADGRDEIALEGGFGMGGQYSRGVSIAAFQEGGLSELGHVNVYEDICGMGVEGSEGPTRSEISAVAGSGLMIEHFRKSTCDSQTWEPAGGPEPLVLEPPDKNPFVDITEP